MPAKSHVGGSAEKMRVLPLFLSRWSSIHFFSSLLRHQTVKLPSCLASGAPASTSRELHSPVESNTKEKDPSERRPTNNSEDPQGKKAGPWRPLKRLSREEMNHMRSLKELQPEEWTNGKLARVFGVSGSAVKRILRSRFEPSSEVEARQERRVEEVKKIRKERLSAGVHTTPARLGHQSQSQSEH